MGVQTVPRAGCRAGCAGLVVFDFDQTLSVVHVYKLLRGAGPQGPDRLCVPASMIARTELGQLRLAEELDGAAPFADLGGFALSVLGGARRVAWLKGVLQELRQQGLDLIVCSRGLLAVVRRCLSDVGLLSLFTRIYARVGEEYGVTNYDEFACQSPPSAAELKLLGTAADGWWKRKVDVINIQRKQMGLSKDDVILIDDDVREIAGAKDACRTVLVREAGGITADDFEELWASVAGAQRREKPIGSLGTSAGHSSPPRRPHRPSSGAFRSTSPSCKSTLASPCKSTLASPCKSALASPCKSPSMGCRRTGSPQNRPSSESPTKLRPQQKSRPSRGAAPNSSTAPAAKCAADIDSFVDTSQGIPGAVLADRANVATLKGVQRALAEAGPRHASAFTPLRLRRIGGC